jgi:glycerate-2-kinase
MFAAAVAAVQPAALLRRVSFLPRGFEFAGQVCCPAGRLHLVALGKAAPGLADAFLRRSERQPDSVFVLAPDDAPTPARVAASTHLARHPVPDARGASAARELLQHLAGTTEDDGIVLLLSGGSSALLAEPLPGLDLAQLELVTTALLAAGAPINELNLVRRHALAAAGGRLALACRAPIVTLVVSDVPGDDLAIVGSGPTAADTTTCADALAVLRRHHLEQRLAPLADFFAGNAAEPAPEPVKPGDRRLRHSFLHLLGCSRDALDAAARVAEGAGFRTAVLTTKLHGEATSVGGALAALAHALTSGEATAVLAAGETTVTVRGAGRGGRNLELALAAACTLAGTPERCILAAGSDGVDGTAPAAGAVVDGTTLARAVAAGRDAAAALANNDSWGFFKDLPDAIVTGPTGANVADLAFVLAAGGVPPFLGLEVRSALRPPVLGGATSGSTQAPQSPPPRRRTAPR